MTSELGAGSGITQPLTLNPVSVSEGVKSGVFSKFSQMSITMDTVLGETFLEDSRAKTLSKMSHSGWSGLCLASKGKYLRDKQWGYTIVVHINNDFYFSDES